MNIGNVNPPFDGCLGGLYCPLLDKKDKKQKKVGKEFGNTKISCYLCNRKST
jgi:hypothetical protein